MIKATQNIAYGKAVGLDEIPEEVWKLENFKEFLLESCNRIFPRTYRNMDIWIISSFSKERKHTYHYKLQRNNTNSNIRQNI